MDQENLHDEEALSTAEIDRVKTSKKMTVKKSFTIVISISFIVCLGYLASLVNWKKIINDRKQEKKENLIIVYKNLSEKFLDDNF